jgi:hypothetical protein
LPSRRTKRSKPVIRPAIASDFLVFSEEPLPWRVKAWTGTLDGKVIGLGGVATLPDGTKVGFAHFTAEARRFPATLHRTSLRLLAEIRREGVRRIVATPDEDIGGAAHWLARLGFEPVAERDGVKAFQWQPE